MEDLGYTHDFPVTIKKAYKVFDLEWSSYLVNSLSMGVNIFTLYWIMEEEAEVVKGQNACSDQMQSSDATAFLTNITTIFDSINKAHIMKTLWKLCYTLEQVHAFWSPVLLGAHHPKMAQNQKYRTHLVDHKMELQHTLPHDKSVAHLVPTLLAHHIQIDNNIWLQAQGRNPGHESVLEMTQIFRDIDRKKDWPPGLPLLYFQPPASDYADSQQSVGGISGMTMGTGLANTIPTLVSYQDQQAQIQLLQQQLQSKSLVGGTSITQQVITSNTYKPIFDPYKTARRGASRTRSGCQKSEASIGALRTTSKGCVTPDVGLVAFLAKEWRIEGCGGRSHAQ